MTPLEEANVIFMKAWEAQCSKLENGFVQKLPGLFLAFGRVPLPFFNVILLDSPVEDVADLESRLALAVRKGSESAFPWLLVICDEWVSENYKEVIARKGFSEALRLFGMATNKLSPPKREFPPLEYLRVEDDTGCEIIAEINCEAYGLPMEIGTSIAVPSLWDKTTFPYIGFYEGTAASCSATLVVEDVLYVGWVATKPAFQRKGLAEQVMRYSLERAGEATGLSRTVLHATESGLPLYRTLGYEITGSFTLYELTNESA